MSVDPKRVLFMGIGVTAVCYYRAMLPARTLGADWVGVLGDPPDLGLATGMVKGSTGKPNMKDYEIVVVQQPAGQGWLDEIARLQANGTKVLFEIDDYLHGIKDQESHGFKDFYNDELLAKFDACMEACDGIICSTEWLATAYAERNDVYVCRNGIDIGRYNLERPSRETVNIGWAGATGHMGAMKPWLDMTASVMSHRPKTCFISIGQPYAEGFKPLLGDDRAISIPFCAIEQYPAAMTMMDIALAPTGKGDWYKGKSDLRWLEAGALGIPVIASRRLYPEIDHGITGLHATSHMQVAEHLFHLIDNKDARDELGRNARHYIENERSIEATSRDWVRVFEHVA